MAMLRLATLAALLLCAQAIQKRSYGPPPEEPDAGPSVPAVPDVPPAPVATGIVTARPNTYPIPKLQKPPYSGTVVPVQAPDAFAPPRPVQRPQRPIYFTYPTGDNAAKPSPQAPFPQTSGYTYPATGPQQPQAGTPTAHLPSRRTYQVPAGRKPFYGQPGAPTRDDGSVPVYPAPGGQRPYASGQYYPSQSPPQPGTEIALPPIRSSFSCDNRAYGYYADTEYDCAVYHHCNPVTTSDGITVFHQYSHYCSPGAVFSQVSLVCVHPRELSFPCADSPTYYVSSNLEFTKTIAPYYGPEAPSFQPARPDAPAFQPVPPVAPQFQPARPVAPHRPQFAAEAAPKAQPQLPYRPQVVPEAAPKQQPQLPQHSEADEEPVLSPY